MKFHFNPVFSYRKEMDIMSWNTKLTKLLSIDYPIIQGAMAYISDGVLAAAMNHAGCAGVIGSDSLQMKSGTVSGQPKTFWETGNATASI